MIGIFLLVCSNVQGVRTDNFRPQNMIRFLHEVGVSGAVREPRQYPLSNSGSKSFTEKCRHGGQLPVTSDPHVCCPIIYVSVVGTLVACCINVRNVEINLHIFLLAVLRLFLLQWCLYLFPHMTVILISMTSIFDVIFALVIMNVTFRKPNVF